MYFPLTLSMIFVISKSKSIDTLQICSNGKSLFHITSLTLYNNLCTGMHVTSKILLMNISNNS